jgi:DHA2 family multidrug resistance protein
MEADAAARAATSMFGRAVVGEATVIAFDTAFNSVALLFLLAAPIVITVKVVLARTMGRRKPGTAEEGSPP